MPTLKSAVVASRAIRRATGVHRAGLAATLRRFAWLYRRDFSPYEIELYDLLDPALPVERLERMMSRQKLIEMDERQVVPSYLCLTSDKAVFYTYCEALGFPIPRLYAVFDHPHGRTFDGRTPATRDEWCAVFASLPAPFVVKPALGLRGLGVGAYRRDGERFIDQDGVALTVEELYDSTVARAEQNLFAGDYSHHSLGLDGGSRKVVVQQQLFAHPVIAELSGTSSLSTCRVITLVDQGGQPSILGTALRIVAGKNFTDNFRRGATGNLWASLDVREGRITDVYAPVAGAACLGQIVRHPDTGRELVSFEVPCWQEVRTLALGLASAFRPQGMIVWDIAVTGSGAVVVEGNVGGNMLPTPMERPIDALLGEHKLPPDR